MSTKIYNAFRLKPSIEPWAFFWHLQERARENARQALRAHYWDLVCRMDQDIDFAADLAKKGASESNPAVRLDRARAFVRKSYKENLGRPERDKYTLDVTVGVYPYKGRYYLRTFCDSCSVMEGVLDFVEQLPELEDYHYQNQTDRPEEVSAAAWLQRRKTWDGITSDKYAVGNHVTLDIVSWSSFYFVDPFGDMAREWHREPPQLPLPEEVWASDMRKLRSLRAVTITAEPGVIRCSKFVVLQQGDTWTATIGTRKPRRFPTLHRAADHVWFEFQPEETKRWVRNMIAESKARRRAEKEAKRGKVP